MSQPTIPIKFGQTTLHAKHPGKLVLQRLGGLSQRMNEAREVMMRANAANRLVEARERASSYAEDDETAEARAARAFVEDLVVAEKAGEPELHELNDAQVQMVCIASAWAGAFCQGFPRLGITTDVFQYGERVYEQLFELHGNDDPESGGIADQNEVFAALMEVMGATRAIVDGGAAKAEEFPK